MTSRNSMLLCPASTMYSTAEATSPEIGPPAAVTLPIDMFQPHFLIHSRSVAPQNVDLGQRSTITWQWRRGRAIGPYPRHRQLPGEGENDRSDKETDNSMRERSPDDPYEDDECRRCQAAPHHQRSQDVVEHADNAQEQRQKQRCGKILVYPDPNNHGKQDNCGADLHDRQEH